jgi:hypothetical protein
MAVDDRILEELMIFDADAAELELDRDEEDGPPTVVELVQPTIVKRGPLCRQAASTDSMATCGDDPAQCASPHRADNSSEEGTSCRLAIAGLFACTRTPAARQHQSLGERLIPSAGSGEKYAARLNDNGRFALRRISQGRLQRKDDPRTIGAVLTDGGLDHYQRKACPPQTPYHVAPPSVVMNAKRSTVFAPVLIEGPFPPDQRIEPGQDSFRPPL